MEMICQECGFSSSYEEEVCYYDINGYAVGHESIEVSNPDTNAYVLCNDCADDKFS